MTENGAEAREWLSKVTPEMYNACTAIQKAVFSEPGTKGKMIIAKVIEQVQEAMLVELKHLIRTMKDKNYYEDIILEEVEKFIKKRSNNP